MSINIAMWSGPRNISTAMMRAFSSRADCAVSDEPFYGCFLKHTGESHPYAAETIAAMDCDWHSVRAAMDGVAPGWREIWYQKHMAHHMVGPVDMMDLTNVRHVILIRDPDLVVASYADKNELREPDHLGYRKLADFQRRWLKFAGVPTPVFDSNAILADPEGQLKLFCEKIGIAWDPAMLSWPAGPHMADGVWSLHWYGSVWNSTGFGPPTPYRPLSGEARRVSDACREDYEYLKSFVVGAAQ